MAIKKVYDLSVDLKRTRIKANVPVLVQGDSTEFRLRLLENGKELTPGQISGVTSVELLSGYDAQTIIRTVGTMQGSEAVFSIGQGELFKTGQVKAMVRLADADDRISTLNFEYQVISDLTANYIPGEQDVSIFQQYISDAQQKIDEMAATDVQQLSAQLAEKENYRQVNNEVSPNMVAGYIGNSIAANLYACTIAGGGSNTRENLIGATENMAIGVHDPNVIDETTDARYSVIGGGYDNVANGLASVLTGFHCLIRKQATHGTISGGSGQEIGAGDYNTIAGGTQNKIEGGGNNTVSGGQLNIQAGTKSFRTIAGGQNNKADGVGAVVSGGTTNEATGDYSLIVGGWTNKATASNSSVSGGGGSNEATSLNSAILSGSYNKTIGDTSVILGGLRNIAEGSFSVLGGSDNKTLTAALFSTIAGGRYNTIQKQYGVIAGGTGNTVDGDYSVIAGGQTNRTNGAYSAIAGGSDNTTDGTASQSVGQSAKARTHGQIAHAYGKFAVQGDAQESRLVLKNQTTNDALTVIGLNGASHPQMSPDASWYFKYTIVARRQDVEGETKAWTIEGLAQNNTGASVQIVGTPTTKVIGETASAANWVATVNSGADSLFIQGKGEVGKTIYWVAKLETVEVIA